jgi:hypothetical protein
MGDPAIVRRHFRREEQIHRVLPDLVRDLLGIRVLVWERWPAY